MDVGSGSLPQPALPVSRLILRHWSLLLLSTEFSLPNFFAAVPLAPMQFMGEKWAKMDDRQDFRYPGGRAAGIMKNF